MPVPTTPLTKRLASWMLLHEQPEPLPLTHPIQDDVAAAWDEIERLRAALQCVAAYHDAFPDALSSFERERVDAALKPA